MGDIIEPIRCAGWASPRTSSPSPIMEFRCTPYPGTQTPGPEAEAGGDHAAVALVVDGHDVGGLGAPSGARRASISARAAAGSVNGSPATPAAAACRVPSTSSRSSPAGVHGVAVDRHGRGAPSRSPGTHPGPPGSARRRRPPTRPGRRRTRRGRTRPGRRSAARTPDGDQGARSGSPAWSSEPSGALVDLDPVTHAPSPRRPPGSSDGVGLGERRAVRRLQARTHHVGPGQPSPAPPQVMRAGRDARHRDRGRPDLVGHPLTDEDHLDIGAGPGALAAQAGHADEEVDAAHLPPGRRRTASRSRRRPAR